VLNTISYVVASLSRVRSSHRANILRFNTRVKSVKLWIEKWFFQSDKSESNKSVNGVVRSCFPSDIPAIPENIASGIDNVKSTDPSISLHTVGGVCEVFISQVLAIKEGLESQVSDAVAKSLLT